MSEKSSRMFTYILQCKWFFRFLLGATKGNATCHVPSLLHAGWRSSNSWRLQRTQTSSDSSINWFTRISIWANDCFYSSCSLSQGHKFTQSCRATPCRLWLQPKSQSPRGPSGNTPQWHEIETPAQSPLRACLLAQQFISINVKPLRLLWIDLWPHWISLFLRLCLQMGWGVSCSYKLNEALATNWVYSLRTNTFSPEISSFLNLITQQLFSRPPVAPILSRPTPTCHNQSGVSRELWRGRGSSANGSLKPNLIYM